MALSAEDIASLVSTESFFEARARITDRPVKYSIWRSALCKAAFAPFASRDRYASKSLRSPRDGNLGHPGARKPKVEVDVDDEERHHQNVHPLLEAEKEVFANKKHFEDVDDVAHPPGVMRGVESLRHLQRCSLSCKELGGKV